MRIKYDLKSLKYTKIVGIISLVLCLLGFGVASCEILFEEVGFFTESWFLGLIVFCIEGAGLVTVLCWGSFLVGKCYILRLKSYGYELPLRKKDYDFDVRKLPKVSEPKGVSIGSKYSKTFMIISLVMYIILLVLDSYYYAKWHILVKDSAEALFVLLMIFHLFWPIFAFVLNKQSDKDRYRDDVETDFSKKPRICLESLIIAVLVMGLISLYANMTAHSMTKYIYKSRLAQEQSAEQYE